VNSSFEAQAPVTARRCLGGAACLLENTLRRFLTLLVMTMVATAIVPHTVYASPAAPETRSARLPLAAAEQAGEAVDRSQVERAPISFSGLWVEMPEGVDAVRVRTFEQDRGWDDWYELEAVDATDDGPDPSSTEARDAERRGPRDRAVSDYLAVGSATDVQVELVGADDVGLDEVEVVVLDTHGLNESVLERVARELNRRPQPAEASSVPTWIKPRSAWGARWVDPSRVSSARGGVTRAIVHHTAGRNGYSQSEVPGIIRGIQNWHIDGNGWTDIGYNVVIDRFGGVWEGRVGGLDKAIVGAHAAGHNSGSVGVSVLGNYVSVTPEWASISALAKVIGWQAGIYGFNPQAWGAVIGHRDVGQTSCPGLIQGYLPWIRTSAAQQAFPFTDIAGNTHASAITDLYRRGVIGGYADGTYRPLRSVSRGEVATLLARAFGVTPVAGQRFSDVPRGSTHEGAINALTDRGWIRGYDDGTFRPDAELRRDHMAVILQRALGLTPRPDEVRFTDVRSYRGEINAIAHAEVTLGCAANPPRYCPTNTVNRGEMATFLLRATR
jgi:hypothetical protein